MKSFREHLNVNCEFIEMKRNERLKSGVSCGQAFSFAMNGKKII